MQSDTHKKAQFFERIKRLPDFYALKKLAASLWKEEATYQGAAIMIGSGFSRSAAKTGDPNKKMPLWADLASKLAEDIGESPQTVDALRLAEEYQAYHGKQALHDVLKKEINNSAWVPGELYSKLLTLPWAEILTTNWDTLLEQAADNIHSPLYSVVNKQEDLASSSSPRIVKLHGTIDQSNELIFTQEDYRKYPKTNAAFVNFARQIFIENELCLLGFSGDDPNFLQWAGWVRDNLSNDARRIYLVGALNLNAAKRKYLEKIGISPIDFSDIVSIYDERDKRHLEAIKLFIEYLHGQKPSNLSDWEPTQLVKYGEVVDQDTIPASQKLQQQLPILQQDRQSYPDWLVCPENVQWWLYNQINHPFPSKTALEELSDTKRAQLLYEIIWRDQVTNALTPDWIVEFVLQVFDGSNDLTTTQKSKLAIHLLKNSRWIDTEDKQLETFISNLINKNISEWPEAQNELIYHQALVVKDSFDYPKMEELASKLSDKEPIWKLRKASFLTELGLFTESGNLITQAYRTLQRQFRNNKHSIHVLSQLAWAHMLYRAVQLSSPTSELEKFPLYYKEAKTDPWDFLESLNKDIDKKLSSQNKQQGIEVTFEPGSYKDNASTVTLNNGIHPILRFYTLTDDVGVPIRFDSAGLLSDSASLLCQLNDIDIDRKFVIAIRVSTSETSEAINKVFSRINLASIPQDVANKWIEICGEAIGYWLNKRKSGSQEEHSEALNKLRVFIEILARLQIRATQEKAKEAFKLAMLIGDIPECRHYWLFGSLEHLISYSLESVPKFKQPELLLDALKFPLERELSLSIHDRWPNPIIESFGKKQNLQISNRIDEIIDLISPCNNESLPSLLRLMPMLKNNYLTKTQKNRISEKIWGKNPNYSVLPEVGLLKFALLKLPNNNKSSVKKLVRSYLFKQSNESVLLNPHFLLDIVNSAISEDIQEKPNSSQAKKYFKTLVNWQPDEENHDTFGIQKRQELVLGGRIGLALSNSIVPALNNTDLTEENFKLLSNFYEQVNSPELLTAFVYFACADSSLVKKVEELLTKGLLDQASNVVAYSAFAVLTWCKLKGRSSTEKLIHRLVYAIVMRRQTGLPSIMWSITEIYKMGCLDLKEKTLLIESVPMVFDASDYSQMDPESHAAVDVSLVRKACIKLAKEMLKHEKTGTKDLKRILTEAKSDALPEVRFAEYADE